MKIHVILTNQFECSGIAGINIKKCVCLVIDTIRAASTIATMLGCGGVKVLIASDKRKALQLKSIFNSFILCGEEGGIAPEGFDYGNSPLDISGINAAGKTFILMTTNGTKSILKIEMAKKIYVLSLLNLYSTLDCAVKDASVCNSDILFLCSGEKGKIAYDDAYTAGLAIKYLMTRPLSIEYSDTSKLVLGSAVSEQDITSALEKSCSARSLRSVGLGDDIAFLSQVNKYRVCPVLVRISAQSKIEKFYISNTKKHERTDSINDFFNLYGNEPLYYMKNNI
jgi:2-phosphosulfolactate phosphatase